MPVGAEFAGAHTRGALPSESSSFVGRRAERSTVASLLGETRQLTLIGPGGVGKTRLALRVAAEAADAFEDGVRLVMLGDVVDPALLATKVGDALGVEGQTQDQLLERLVIALGGHQLLVLDNCEHLVEAVASLLNGLLPRTRHLRVLATSRQSLGIEFERSWQVPPLSVPDPGPDDSSDALRDSPEKADAVALLLERSDALATDAELTRTELEAAVEICRRLDGLPLAIELAAIRTRSLSFQQVLGHLDDRFELLTLARRGAAARHGNLRALVDWSYRLCTPAERDFWAQASVFAGGFDLESARSVYLPHEDSASVIDLIDALVDKSILRIERTEHPCRTMRYRMLETIREYGEQHVVQGGDEDALRRRHRDYFTSLADDWHCRWFGPDQAEIISAIKRDWPNLQRALDFSISQPHEATVALDMVANLFYYHVKSAVSEGRIWGDRALALSSAPTVARARALWANSWLAVVQGDLSTARRTADELCGMAPSLGQDVQRLAGLAEAFLAIVQGDPQAARGALAPLGPTPQGAAGLTTRHMWGLASLVDGDLPTARETFEGSVAICEEVGEQWLRAHALRELTYIAHRQGDPARTRELSAKALRLHLAMDDQLGVGHSLEHLAWSSPTDLQAAQLLGAASRKLGDIGAQRHGFLEEEHVRCRDRLTRTLGEDAFRAAFDVGHALPLGRMVDLALPKHPDDARVLTRRESEVAGLVAQGMSNREIAESLFISPRTVETHVERILAKLGLRSRGQVGPSLHSR